MSAGDRSDPTASGSVSAASGAAVRQAAADSATARLVSLAVILTLIIVLGVTFFRIVAPFIMPMFLAAVLAILCQPLYRYFFERFGRRRARAAGLTTAAVVSVVVIPTVVGISLGVLQLYTFAQNNLADGQWRETVRYADERFHIRELIMRWQDFQDSISLSSDEQSDSAEGASPASTDAAESTLPVAPTESVPSVASATSAERPAGPAVVDSPATSTAENAATTPADGAAEEGLRPETPPAAKSEEHRVAIEAMEQKGEQLRLGLRQAIEKLVQLTLTPNAAFSTVNVMTAIAWWVVAQFTFLFAFYYFLADGSDLMEYAEALIPVRIENQRRVVQEFVVSVRAVVSATMLAAGAQGLATSLVLWAMGFGNFFINTILATLLALIPLAGTWLVWGPCAIWLAAGGHWGQFVFLTIYGMLFISLLDNVIRTYALNSDAKLHPLLAFVCILGGIQALGLWGVFIAPVVACCLHALVKIFNQEIVDLSRVYGGRVKPRTLRADDVPESLPSFTWFSRRRPAAPGETAGSPLPAGGPESFPTADDATIIRNPPPAPSPPSAPGAKPQS